MNPTHWGSGGVIATEESTVITTKEQQFYEIWTVKVLDTGTAVPERLDSQLGDDFEDAVRNWAELTGNEEYFDPLTLSFNGMPLIGSRDEAMALMRQYRQSQQ